MTWYKFVKTRIDLRYAASFVAYFVCAGAASAQNVTFSSDGNDVELSGRFVSFDGTSATMVIDDALVSFRTEGLICVGEACPNLAEYVPSLKMSGASQMADVLLPALIDVYARDQGWTVHEDVNGFKMTDSAGNDVFEVSLFVATPDEAFETFMTHDTDALLSMRELRTSEVEAAYDAGLGRVTLARQARILALDALVPVVSPTSDLRFISLADLTATLAGVSSDLEVHLPAHLDGQLQGFEDRFMGPFGLQMANPDVGHADRNGLTSAVETGANGISLLPFGETRNTQPLSLSGPCGLVSDARFLTMKTEDYPLTFPMFLYLPQRTQHPQINDFLDWLRSPSAQLVIRRAGFVDLAAVAIPLADQGDRLANAITNAGPEVPLTELQRMVRLLEPRVRMSSTFRFEPGSTRLDGQSRSNVMQLAQAIHDGRFGGRELLFVGFSDGRGPADANRDLSSARAEAVRRDVERALGGQLPRNVVIGTEAFGEALPMACDDTIWGQQTNRRVELWVKDAD
ncbi:phosphate ABC transporter substrate-binding/OmpA family protein [Octadecabacter sp. 1_MG-2023]|uniref:phosphate ABC transporter substrate-binding/OmpA family protein n=1 Tax=Octadecabacter sp. B2R22 TaxID=2841570 RepID=UPI001C084E4B|nr:phosphate ABC transporter substrate-binding/OmpA family protein [Octadecabacter sp. B2R22]MDO6734980.1 phosphate ABC transporter substrate-binding/OmpA family protein [Octadecabacter sp. 1_MG-2023]